MIPDDGCNICSRTPGFPHLVACKRADVSCAISSLFLGYKRDSPFMLVPSLGFEKIALIQPFYAFTFVGFPLKMFDSASISMRALSGLIRILSICSSVSLVNRAWSQLWTITYTGIAA